MHKPIRLTKPAVQRALKYDLPPETIQKINIEDHKQPEGKTKVRYNLNSKNGVWIAICQETPDFTIIITITNGRNR